VKQSVELSTLEILQRTGKASAQRQTVCVVVPIYSTQLKPTESVSLDRCMSMLGAHPITFVRPHHLNIDQLTNKYPQTTSESFRSEFFDGVQGYNNMMLSDEFYARFSNYEFVLIHQLDAFIFSDQLLQWCARDYDYIGAPWLPKGNAPTLVHRMALSVRRKWYRLFDVHNRHSGYTHDVQLRYSVGNGGLSLRRVAKMREVLAALDVRAQPYRLGLRSSWGEDLFFSIEANRYRPNVRLPPVTEAARFAWETNPKAAAQLTGGQLPFGCHAWNKRHSDEWRPLFAKFGYSLDELLHS